MSYIIKYESILSCPVLRVKRKMHCKRVTTEKTSTLSQIQGRESIRREHLVRDWRAKESGFVEQQEDQTYATL